MQHGETLEAIESAIVNNLNATRIEEEKTQILPSDEFVRRERVQFGAIQIQFSGVHWDPFGQFLVRSRRAVDDIGRPRLIVVASAIVWARHFTVAGVEIATVAEGEAVRLVGAEEIGRSGLNQWHVRTLRSAAVKKAAVDSFEIHNTRMLTQVVGRVDPLQPFPKKK